MSLTPDLKGDDLDLVEMVMEVEDTFEISISDEAAEGFKTVGDMIRHVQGHAYPVRP